MMRPWSTGGCCAKNKSYTFNTPTKVIDLRIRYHKNIFEELSNRVPEELSNRVPEELSNRVPEEKKRRKIACSK
jgi:hypothetical protein